MLPVIALAILPALILIYYTYQQDKLQREPVGNLVKAFFYGGLSVFVSLLISVPLMQMGFFSAQIHTLKDAAATAFFGAAIPEESAKLFLLWLFLRKCRDFDERMDGIVYAVCVGMGFATFENIEYLFASGSDWVTVGLGRSLTAIPGHFGFAVIIALTGSARAFNSALIKAAVPPASDQNIENQTIQNNMGTLTALADGRWDQYTAREKLNVLQTVANIEQRSLGLPHELNVGAEDMSRDKAGTYRDKTHEIRISTASLLYDSPWELVNTVCHEAYHAYQHRLIDLLIETRQENRGLMMFREIREYAEEFQNYTGTDGDFNTYYYQQCESDARDFAEDSEREYFIRIKDYLHPDNEQDNASAEPPVGREIMT